MSFPRKRESSVAAHVIPAKAGIQCRYYSLLAAQAPARATQFLLDHQNGAKTGACIVRCMNVPPGEGSPAGLHIHHFEQIYYVISGTMDLEIDGKPCKKNDAKQRRFRSIALTLTASSS